MNYEFIKKIGKGSQGTVWKAIRVSDGKIIAIKSLPSYNAESTTAAKDEIEKLKMMSKPRCHDNIICYYGYTEEGDNIYVEMEYIDGVDLSEYSKRLRDKGEYDKLYKHLLLITKDLINGLVCVHIKDIIHNDIKPTNIIIDNSLTPVLIDFGIACNSYDMCSFGQDKKPCCRGFGGTPAYASPEMYKNDVRFPQSDIWSLGMTLYESATGKLPYNFKTKPNLYDILQAIQYDEPNKLKTTNNLLNTIVNQALVKNPIDRITTMEIHNLLKNYK